MKTLRTVLIVVLIVIIVIFAWQNSQVVEVNFLVWHWLISRALVIFISFALGLAVGYVGGRVR